jgi:hypothetical protein
MAKGDIVSVTTRPENADETKLREWFDKQNGVIMDNLEAGARQVIQLVTAFYTVLFGVIGLGKDKFGLSVTRPEIIFLGGATILLLLAALIAALVVVSPFGYRYREASVTDQKATYAAIVARKSTGFTVSGICFGLGLAVLALLVLVMLTARP